MTYHHIDISAGLDLKHVRKFLSTYGTALAKAAHLLGGGGASARVFLLCESVLHARRLTVAQRRQLVDLHRLLTLENVGDPERIESGLFSEIHPSSPVVEEICLLAENLQRLLLQISGEEPALGSGISATPSTKVA
ncbi:hypothetical protein [Roseovarius sp. D0-M9]|uniref:hypothetical protein n=1 Tax=Roseovarius sp. D0-M9 TaxID=3127117 RepID=UPI00300FC2AB